VIAGYIADKLIGKTNTISLGLIILVLGLLLAVLNNRIMLLSGLVFMAIGSTFAETIKLNLLNELFPKEGQTRKRAFLWCFGVINLGCALGPLLFGYVSQMSSYKIPFIVAIIMNILCLVYFLLINKVIKSTLYTVNNWIYTLLITAICFAIGFLSFKYRYVSNGFMLVLLLGCLFWYIKLLIHRNSKEKINLIKILAVTCLSLVFYILYYQLMVTLPMCFITQVNRNIMGIMLPGSSLLSIQTTFVVLITYFMAKITLKSNIAELSNTNSLLFGLFLAGLSFYMFGSMFKDSTVIIPLWLPVLAAAILAGGEVLLSPTISSAITKLAPKEIQGRINGFSILAMSLAGNIAGAIGVIIMHTDKIEAGMFSPIALVIMFVTILIFGGVHLITLGKNR